MRRSLILLLALLAGAASALEIPRKGYYRVQIDGEIMPNNFAQQNTAWAFAVTEYVKCSFACEVLVITPPFQITGNLPIDVADCPEPPPIDPPVAATIQYSYGGTTWEELDSAVLQRIPTMFRYNGEAESLTWYCCKITFEPHRAGVTGLAIDLDFSTFPGDDGGLRELYYDVELMDGTIRQNNYTFFSLEESDAPPVDPPIDPPVFEDTVVTVEWTIPTEREDETALPVASLCCYRVDYGLVGETPRYAVNVVGGSSTSVDIDVKVPGLYNFRVSAIDTTPEGDCTEDSEPYTCGGPLQSAPSDWIEADIR